MKSATFYMAIAALMFAGCSQNEVIDTPLAPSDPAVISFNSSIGTTRAISNDLNTVKSGFNVLGFKKDGIKFLDGTDGAATYKFTSSWDWAQPAGKTWSENSSDYPITFYAEYPQIDMSSNANLNKEITMDLNMANQIDYLVAKSEVAGRPSSGFAPLNFKHILSSLVFKIETCENYKVVIKSIRIVNTAKSGRTFNYKTMGYDMTESYTTGDYASTDGTHKANEGFFYSDTKWEFTGTAKALVAEVPAKSGIMMQMPQFSIPYWVDDNLDNGLGKFKEDVAKWKGGSESESAKKLLAWYNNTSADAVQPGMKNSAGWGGARIEVIYRIYDTANNKSIIGRQAGENLGGSASGTAAEDYYIRVGYPLDLSAITVMGNTNKGWEMNKRYTYTIQMGTPKATNGVLLDPDYKTEAGNPDKPGPENPENPTPGEPATPGQISFTVSVDSWTETPVDIH